ncbi:unnamed protein product [Diabrotica balteata]|uniref:Uncharacterized protein n=1 Tax=Diabrotica balteata TaxID=107213 RepID=A0A9N9XC87_DIABA|nr:unnamed protein product [Diabrotica balteata]
MGSKKKTVSQQRVKQEIKERNSKSNETRRKEIFKLNQKRSGDGADDEPQSKWHYFQNMAFLKDHFTPRKTSGIIENAVQEAFTYDEMEDEVTLSSMMVNDHSQLENQSEMSQQSETLITPSSSNDTTKVNRQRETANNLFSSNDKKSKNC